MESVKVAAQVGCLVADCPMHCVHIRPNSQAKSETRLIEHVLLSCVLSGMPALLMCSFCSLLAAAYE